MLGMDGLGGGMNPFAGFAGLVIGMALVAIATPILSSAGKKKVRDEPWQGQAIIGGILTLGAVGAAVSALGSFFGFMGVLFAVFFAVGGFQAFNNAQQKENKRREDLEHARELGDALRHGSGNTSGAPQAGRGTLLNGEPLPGSTSRQQPEWYSDDDTDGGSPGQGRPSS